MKANKGNRKFIKRVWRANGVQMSAKLLIKSRKIAILLQFIHTTIN